MFDILSIHVFILCSGGKGSYIMHCVFTKYIIGIIFSGGNDKNNYLDLIPNAVAYNSSKELEDEHN